MSVSPSKRTGKALAVVRSVEGFIRIIRDQKVMLDSVLAGLYGVTTKALNQAVRRNWERFPGDFMFKLTSAEANAMRSQIVTSSKRNIKFQSFAFTEHGIAMPVEDIDKLSREIRMIKNPPEDPKRRIGFCVPYD